MNIFFLRGVSCSGKSFWCNALKENGVHIFSSDTIAEEEFGIVNGKNPPEVFAVLQKKAVEALKSGKSIAIDATNLTVRKSRFWIDMAKKFKSDIICIYFDLNEEDMNKNIEARHNGKWSHMSVEDIRSIVENQKQHLAEPNEFEKVIWVKQNMSSDEIARELKKFL